MSDSIAQVLSNCKIINDHKITNRMTTVLTIWEWTNIMEGRNLGLNYTVKCLLRCQYFDQLVKHKMSL